MSPRLRPLAGALLAAILFGTFTPALAYAQRGDGWRRINSEAQQKINALPQTAEANVTIPILFGVEVSDLTPNFGDPRSGGRAHEGLDIMAPRGTPIVSPTQAVVLRTGTGSSAGIYVYTANPGDETFVYMHLDAIADGVTSGKELARGDIIGYVGNTGNAVGGPAHLHFELRKDRTPTDPLPRLTSAFTQEERLTYISKIFSNASNANNLAVQLVTNFRNTFTNMQTSGMTLPAGITNALATVPLNATPPSSSSAKNLPEGDLDIGSSGIKVVDLQRFLIAQAKGPATARLAGAGATGYFGAITQSALIEYQKAEGIEPATGYFGPVTREHIAAAVINMEGSVEDEIFADNGGVIFTRDLSRGSTGEDVRALQVFLNEHGFVVASAGESGSTGFETVYFGVATERALAKYQASMGITPAVGYFGPITRAKVSS